MTIAIIILNIIEAIVFGAVAGFEFADGDIFSGITHIVIVFLSGIMVGLNINDINKK